MSTLRSSAVYFAKQAFSVQQMTGHADSRMSRADTPDGARWTYLHTSPDGARFAVVLRSSASNGLGGAVDAPRTKAANTPRTVDADPVDADPVDVDALCMAWKRITTRMDARIMEAVESPDWLDSLAYGIAWEGLR